MCGTTAQALVHTYTAPPEGEGRFKFSGAGYHREIWQCARCGHFVSQHAMDEGDLYAGEYVNATYAEDTGLRRNFDRINALPPERSDNIGRVQRVVAFAQTRLAPEAKNAPTILDVGSGLCVFLHRMKAAGWDGTALDPDARAVQHAQEIVGVKAVRGNFITVEGLGQFDVIAFNKVLEHIQDPLPMLLKAKGHLNPGGFIYAELPDGELAALDGFHREEFFIEHWHIFSAASLVLLAQQAQLAVLTLERLREPSTKYTLRAFLAPCPPTVH
jgi:2-polyprenyl-3-methyl-5-hydroxy-6-metoxy-1,4-benzoquinol methylase